jgi:hypothetical protein
LNLDKKICRKLQKAEKNVKVDQLNKEKRELLNELDEYRLSDLKPQGKDADQFRETINMMKKEQEIMKDE